MCIHVYKSVIQRCYIEDSVYGLLPRFRLKRVKRKDEKRKKRLQLTIINKITSVILQIRKIYNILFLGDVNFCVVFSS